MFWVYGLFSLMTPLLGLAVAALCVWIIWRTLTLPRRGVRFAACESCRYDVGEASSFTCPECGADLRLSGIITPQMETRRRGSLTGAIIAWTVLCLMGGSVATTFMFMYTAMGVGAAAANPVTTWQLSLTPNSRAYREVLVTYDSDWQAITSTVQIELMLDDGSGRTLTLDPVSMKVIGLAGGESDWDGTTIESWFGESDLDVTDPAIAAEAREIGVSVDLLLMSPSSGYALTGRNLAANFVPTGGFAGGGAMTTWDDEVTMVLIGATLGIGVYAIGIVLMCFRRARLRRGAASTG